MVSLPNALVKEQYTVKWNYCDMNSRETTEQLGFVTGAELAVVSSFFGNVIVLIEGRRIALSKEIADRIKV